MDIAMVPPARPDDPRAAARSDGDRRVKLVVLWAATVGVVMVLYVFAGYVWGSLGAAALLAAMSGFTWWRCRVDPGATEEPGAAALRADGGGACAGLSQEDVDDAIPAFEYRRKAGAAAEQCAVCISAVRDGEMLRRLPACGHAFHAPCVDGWLRAHATCPMCRSDVMISGEPAAEAMV